MAKVFISHFSGIHMDTYAPFCVSYREATALGDQSLHPDRLEYAGRKEKWKIVERKKAQKTGNITWIWGETRTLPPGVWLRRFTI